MLNILARDDHHDEGDLLLLRRPLKDAAYCVKRAVDLLGGNLSTQAGIFRALLMANSATLDAMGQVLDSIPNPPDRTFAVAPCLAPCGGDIARHEPALDGKGGLRASDDPPLGRIHFFGPLAGMTAPQRNTATATAPGEPDAEPWLESERAASDDHHGHC